MNFPSESRGLSEEVRGAGGGERWRQRKGEPESSAAAGRVLNIELVMKTNNSRWRRNERSGDSLPPARPVRSPFLVPSAWTRTLDGAGQPSATVSSPEGCGAQWRADLELERSLRA